MKVLMPSRILDRHVGGNTTYARKIAEGLARRGVSVGRVPSVRNPLGTMALETLWGVRRGGHDEVIHYVADTGPLLRTARPSVLTVHGVASRWITVARTRRQELVWRARVRRAIDCVDRIITVSNSSRQDVSDVFGVPVDRIRTIPHGIDVETFSCPVRVSDGLTEKLPSEFALYVGNIEPRKNLEALISAFEHPEIAKYGIPLVIAGAPAWNFTSIIGAIKRSQNVIHVGFVSEQDKIALMQSAKLFVFPSLYEGFGFPVLEGMAAGAPVLCSGSGSLAEVAGPALRFPGLNDEGVMAGVAHALANGDARARAAAAGRLWVRRFSWKASVDAHLKVYEEALGR